MFMQPVDLNGLFIYDLANNHQGDLDHALKIVQALGEVTRKAGVKAAFKFQFRELDSFIHPAFRDNQEHKHIQRFLGTRLSNADFARLTDAVRQAGMVTMATPFDEASVDLLESLDIEIIKVASCSATDWPLLHRIARSSKPVVVSTAGLEVSQIDRLVNLLEGRTAPFALMHCVALYPTPPDKLRLNQIDFLRARYPRVPIGFSTHESADHQTGIAMACAKGATLFERHVGIAAGPHKLNNYSANPEQVAQWLALAQAAMDSCGGSERSPSHPDELQSLRSLKRGVYAKRNLKAGEALAREDVFFAMPLQEEQMESGLWNPSLKAEQDYQAGQAISRKCVRIAPSTDELVFGILLQVQGLLNNARIFMGRDSHIELSHHFGLERFREFGAVLITCINREYCKKLVVMLPRQKHPYHFHKLKEETFQLLYGDLEVELEGKKSSLKPGDTVLVLPNQWHKFHTLDGAIFEEVSTTHRDGDSYYEEAGIVYAARENRKTAVPNWQHARTGALS